MLRTRLGRVSVSATLRFVWNSVALSRLSWTVTLVRERLEVKASDPSSVPLLRVH